MTTKEAIAILDGIVEPGRDLPEELFLFVSRVTPLINVDLLIQGQGNRTLLTWRDDQFYGAGWHIPGGIIRYKECAADRIQKVASEEIGCSVEFDRTPVTIVESIVEDRNRGHFISLLYRCQLMGEPDPARRADRPPRRGQWKWHSGVPSDLLPAQRMYAKVLQQTGGE